MFIRVFLISVEKQKENEATDKVQKKKIGRFFVDNLSPIMKNPALCICENKGADQLQGNQAPDQRLCFRYIDTCSITPLLPKSEISSLKLSTVVVQLVLCQTWSET